MQERKTYVILNRKFYLQKILVEQFVRLSELWGELEVSEKDKPNLTTLIRKIADSHLDKFMSEIVFFDQDTSGIEWKNVEYDLVYEIVTDFFALNPRLKETLMNSISIFLVPFLKK